MPQVKVSYYGHLRSIVGATEESLEMPAGTTLRGLLNALASRHGPRLTSSLCNTDGSLVVGDVAIAVDGVAVDSVDSELTGAKGVEIALIPSIAGGAAFAGKSSLASLTGPSRPTNLTTLQ